VGWALAELLARDGGVFIGSDEKVGSPTPVVGISTALVPGTCLSSVIEYTCIEGCLIFFLLLFSEQWGLMKGGRMEGTVGGTARTGDERSATEFRGQHGLLEMLRWSSRRDVIEEGRAAMTLTIVITPSLCRPYSQKRSPFLSLMERCPSS
jgi:hypothetical protein